MTPSEQGTRRLCSLCGAREPGMYPTGWLIEQHREPIGPGGLMMVVRETPVCLDCQHPELREDDR